MKLGLRLVALVGLMAIPAMQVAGAGRRMSNPRQDNLEKIVADLKKKNAKMMNDNTTLFSENKRIVGDNRKMLADLKKRDAEIARLKKQLKK